MTNCSECGWPDCICMSHCANCEQLREKNAAYVEAYDLLAKQGKADNKKRIAAEAEVERLVGICEKRKITREELQLDEAAELREKLGRVRTICEHVLPSYGEQLCHEAIDDIRAETK